MTGTADKQSITEYPDLYDWLYGDFAEDIPMYSALVQPYSSTLECGVGTGRIAIALAESGKVVYGIDSSLKMLQQLERNVGTRSQALRDRIHIYKADMRDFNLGREFMLVYVPFSTFNYLLTIEEQRAALASIRKHVAREGTLVLEILSFSHYPAWFESEPTLRKIKETRDTRTGRAVAMWKVGRFDCVTQTITEDRHFRFYDAQGKLEREEVIFWENRLFFIGEMRLLLENAGFEIANVYGDFDFGPYLHSSEIAVVTARPA
jgi:SAM-dependent methyltransferase